ncbi:MAG TPA: hypothetical protein VD789_09480 [Thermomicrobiales bacterium]|nr:hypothetical protein [Thermomicrobiales bacterium]
MNPFRRRKRTRRDMIVLGGWLFADLLLGLAMIFLVANTVGAPPPTPTPTATPNELATAEASFAAAQVENQATREALEGNIAMMEQTAAAQEADAARQRIAATETAEAQATEAAMSDAELATREAEATEEAIVAQATISAFSTEVASSDESEAALSADLATTAAQATEVAAAATEQASSGANTIATIEALEASNASNADALATSEAELANLQESSASSESALATAEAEQAALAARQSELEATATAFVEAAPPGSMNPNSVEEVIQVDLSGLLSGDDNAVEDAEQIISETFAPYVQEECQAGFVLTSSRAPELGQGVQLSDEINEMLVNTVPEVFSADTTAFESVAYPGTQPTGEVFLNIFFYAGCGLMEDGGEG